MKKEYILLLIIIIALGAYLLLRDKNRESSLLPEIPSIETEEIESIDIAKDGVVIHCYKDNDTWVVTENKFPCDENVIKEMTASIKDLTVTTLVSEKEDLKRYELDKKNSIRITAKTGNTVLREFTIGKTVPTRKHTFINLAGEKGVFHAKGNLKRKFNKSVDNLRDKQIQKFDRDDIKNIEIIKGKRTRTISAKDLDLKGSDQEKEKAVLWEANDKKNLDKAAIDDLLGTLADLRCSSYKEDLNETDFKSDTDLLSVILKTGKKSGRQYRVDLSLKKENDKYIGTSSNNKYIFILENYVAASIISNVDKLLNIETEKDNEGAS